MRVLVFEQWGGGHYTEYLRYLLPPICDLATEVTLAVRRRFADSEEFRNMRGESPGNRKLQLDDTVPEADPSLPWSQHLEVLGHLRDAIERSRPDYVFVPSGDAQTLALGLLSPLTFGRLDLGTQSECILHQGYGPGRMDLKSRSKRVVYNTAFRRSSWSKLNFVNFLMYEAFKTRRHPGMLGMVPDPVPEPELVGKREARRALGIPEDGRMIGFVGMMDHRKAIPELLHAFRDADLARNDRLLLAGELKPAYAALIRGSYGDLLRNDRLLILNRRLSRRELQLGLSALDVACLPYYQFPGLSSLMLKAVAARRPILIHDFGWMRAIARRFGVASRCNIFQPAEFSAAIVDALDSAPEYEFAASTQGLLEYHRPASFVDHALVRIRAALQLPSRTLLTWEAVMASLKPECRELI